MEINLNSSTILDEMTAVAALRARGAAARGEARALLTRDQLPALRNILRMAFAELCLRLGETVESSDMDFDDPAPDEPYSAEAAQRMALTLAAAGPKGKELAVKRSLEHAVAMLAAAYALGEETAGELRTEAAAAADAVRGCCLAADAGSVPRRVAPFFF